MFISFFFLMIRRPPRSTRTDTLFPYTTLFRSRDLTPEQVNTAARTLDPGALTWVVVGDLDKIEQPVRALDLGKVSIIDADGKPVADAPAAAKDGEYGSSTLPCEGRGGATVCRLGRAKRNPSYSLPPSAPRKGFHNGRAAGREKE